MMSNDIIVLAGEGRSTRALVNALRRRFGTVPVLLEDKESTWFYLRRRMRRLRIPVVMGQLGFLLAARGLRFLHRGRELEIIAEEGLDTSAVTQDVIGVSSVNDHCAIDILRE